MAVACLEEGLGFQGKLAHRTRIKSFYFGKIISLAITRKAMVNRQFCSLLLQTGSCPVRRLERKLSHERRDLVSSGLCPICNHLSQNALTQQFLGEVDKVALDYNPSFMGKSMLRKYRTVLRSYTGMYWCDIINSSQYRTSIVSHQCRRMCCLPCLTGLHYISIDS